jgi:hypothetical protein
MTRLSVDYNVVDTPTQKLRVLGFRTVQVSRSDHYMAVTVSARTREPRGNWTEIHREDVRGTERWDRSATNRIGGTGALVTDPPSQAALDAAIERAKTALSGGFANRAYARAHELH